MVSMRIALQGAPLAVGSATQEGVKMKKRFTAPRLIAESTLTEITLTQSVSTGDGIEV
jgi:hypothetical protein